jgi:hypothetical protein
MANEITAYRGDTINIECSVVDATGAAFDLTGYNDNYFTVKTHPDDTSYLLQKSMGSGITVPAPLTGVIEITVDAGDTAALYGSYYYDIEIGNGTNVYTVARSTFDIVKEVT